MTTVTNTKVEQLKSYIGQNRSNCRKCHMPMFWVSTSTGKRIPMDFPDQILRPERTHRIILGYSDGVWDGTVEAWPTDSVRATHTCHYDTCESR